MRTVVVQIQIEDDDKAEAIKDSMYDMLDCLKKLWSAAGGSGFDYHGIEIWRDKQ